MNRGIRHCGFTLIEVLVAMAVFGIMAAMASLTIGQTLSNRDMLTERMDRLQSIQRTMSYLSTELLQTMPRSIRTDLGGEEPALRSSFASDFALQLTHGGWPNSAGVPRSTQQRTAYRIEDQELVRYHWNALDRTVNNLPIKTVLLDDIDSLTFRFLPQNTDDWSDQWPPISVQATSNSVARPRAVAIVLTLPDEGELTRIVEVAP